MAERLHLHDLSLERDGPQGPLLVLRNLDLELDLAGGERLALIGGNGAGKSSLLRHLATPGVLPGVRAGLVFQDPDEQLIAATVAEELGLGRPDPVTGDHLAACGLAGREGEDPRLLSAGQKQRLQVATVLGGRPDLLLLDEPTSLQDADQAAWLRQQLDARPEAMIWATQQAEEVALCHRAVVLDRGQPVASGPVPELLARPDVQALLAPDYGPPAAAPVATAAAGPAAPAAAPAPAPLATVDDLRLGFRDGGALHLARWRLAPGDRVGVVGPNGCGKSTLLAVLAGLRRPDAGTVTLAGRRLYGRGRRDLDHGLCALAPQLPEYLLTRDTVAAEIALDPGLAGQDPAAVLATAGLEPDLLGCHPYDLSGGQRRRLALALALASGRPLLLLDEPTAALDAAGRAQVARQIVASPRDGALVIASHDRPFLAACGCGLLDLSGGAAAGPAGGPAAALHGA